MTGVLGELGFGTQVLPVSGSDIQDEKVLGTCHLATGRDDHLGGHITPASSSSATRTPRTTTSSSRRTRRRISTSARCA
jgi:leucyl aminopeptidase (aminopeptidase T)